MKTYAYGHAFERNRVTQADQADSFILNHISRAPCGFGHPSFLTHATKRSIGLIEQLRASLVIG